MQAYCGYIRIEGIERPLRTANEASGWVRKVLFPSKADLEKTKSQEEIDLDSENELFHMSEISDWKKEKRKSFSQIIEHDEESLRKLFEDGAKLNDRQANLVIRAFQVSRHETGKRVVKMGR